MHNWQSLVTEFLKNPKYKGNSKLAMKSAGKAWRTMKITMKNGAKSVKSSLKIGGEDKDMVEPEPEPKQEQEQEPATDKVIEPTVGGRKRKSSKATRKRRSSKKQ